MATLKIYRSQAQTGNVQVPQFGQLAIPIEYAQQQGKAISQIGKVYEQFKAEERETINENRASEIKNEINKKIATAYGSVSNLTDLNQAEAIMKQMKLKTTNHPY
jgi:catalase